jgi:hypothetical protein
MARGGRYADMVRLAAKYRGDGGIERDPAVSVEGSHLMLPHAAIQGESVDQHDRRAGSHVFDGQPDGAIGVANDRELV